MNTFWELEAKQATAEKVAADTWRVTLDVATDKMAVDTAGVETARPMNDLVEIAVRPDERQEVAKIWLPYA